MLQNAPSPLPKNKVIAATIGVPIGQIAFALLEKHLDLPTGSDAAIVSLVVFGLGYLIPDRA